ncbi:hypothetical protein [Dishui Lake phycodnavirus 3]|nr:hypothetical protein [Dishui Lake phycodnavirus 3]
MSSFIKRALVVHDVESDLSYVEINYLKYVPGRGYVDFVDYLNTKSRGDWIEIVSRKQAIQYENFLDTMVEPTRETRVKMATIALENILSGNVDIKTYIRVMNVAKILDPSFTPAFINKKSPWQRKYAEDFCKETLPDIIERTTSMTRLLRAFNVLRLIESE